MSITQYSEQIVNEVLPFFELLAIDSKVYEWYHTVIKCMIAVIHF